MQEQEAKQQRGQSGEHNWPIKVSRVCLSLPIEKQWDYVCLQWHFGLCAFAMAFWSVYVMADG